MLSLLGREDFLIEKGAEPGISLDTGSTCPHIARVRVAAILAGPRARR